MGSQSQSEPTVSSSSASGVARRGGLALVLALVGNVVFVTLANLAGVAPAFEAYSPLVVARGTAIGAVGAAVVYAVLARFSDAPDRLFTGVAVVVYLLGLVPVVVRAPGMAGATTLGVAFLPVMHAIVAVPCVLFLTGRVDWP